MAKNERKNQIQFIIFIFIVFLFIILINNFSYNELKKIEKKEAQLKELNEIKTDLTQSSDDTSEIDQKIAFFTDYYNNLDSVKKEVYQNTILLENKINNNETEAKIAYLTFDDGPYYKTYNYIKILDDYDVKALFFTTSINGEYCYDNKEANCFEVYQEYINHGMEIGNHTYTHSIHKGLYESTENFINAVEMQEEQIKSYANGYTAKIVRFPGGSGQAKSLKASIKEKLRENGYGWIDWTALDGDGGKLKDTDTAWNNFVESINENIEVILLHDYSKYTYEILPNIINYLQENGYIILPLTYDSIMVKK